MFSAVPRHLPASRLEQPGQHVDGRGLARPVGAEQADYLPGPAVKPSPPTASTPPYDLPEARWAEASESPSHSVVRAPDRAGDAAFAPARPAATQHDRSDDQRGGDRVPLMSRRQPASGSRLCSARVRPTAPSRPTVTPAAAGHAAPRRNSRTTSCGVAPTASRMPASLVRARRRIGRHRVESPAPTGSMPARPACRRCCRPCVASNARPPIPGQRLPPVDGSPPSRAFNSSRRIFGHRRPGPGADHEEGVGRSVRTASGR